MNEFIYLECRIGKVVGISDSLIKKARKQYLDAGTDFQLDAVGRLAYTEAAVRKLIESLLNCDKTSAGTKAKAEAVDIMEILSAALVQADPSKKEPLLLAVPWMPPDAVLVVARIFPRNDRIMHGKLHPDWIEKNGVAYERKTGIDPNSVFHRIRVNSTKKFVIGMEVPCRWKQSDLWKCTCRMPYRKGRWN